MQQLNPGNYGCCWLGLALYSVESWALCPLPSHTACQECPIHTYMELLFDSLFASLCPRPLLLSALCRPFRAFCSKLCSALCSPCSPGLPLLTFPCHACVLRWSIFTAPLWELARQTCTVNSLRHLGSGSPSVQHACQQVGCPLPAPLPPLLARIGTGAFPFAQRAS